MKTIYHKITIVFLLALTLFSCEDVVQVDIDPEDIDLVSVEAYLTTDSLNNVWVKLQKSLPIDNSEKNPGISNAVVELSDDAATPNTVVLAESEEAGIYLLPEHTPFKAVPGRTYYLNISTPEGVSISGEDYLQSVEPLDSVKVHLSDFGDDEYLAVYISTQETIGPGHFYKWDIFVNGQLIYEGDRMIFASDELVDGNYIYDFEIFTDWYEDGEEEEKKLHLGDTVQVIQNSISREVYNFYLAMQNQAFAGGPFSVPPANVPGNLISNDGKKVLGLFTARDVTIGNSVVIDSTNFTPLIPILLN